MHHDILRLITRINRAGNPVRQRRWCATDTSLARLTGLITVTELTVSTLGAIRCMNHLVDRLIANVDGTGIAIVDRDWPRTRLTADGRAANLGAVTEDSVGAQ